MVVLVEGRRVRLRLLDGRRGLDRRDVRAKAAGASRVCEGRGRQLARRSRGVLLAASQGSQRCEGVGGVVSRRLRDEAFLRQRTRRAARLAGGRLVVEERVDGTHGGRRGRTPCLR
jgi:hypothetical protein